MDTGQKDVFLVLDWGWILCILTAVCSTYIVFSENVSAGEFVQNVEAECVIREWVKRWFGRFSHSHHPQCLCTAHKQIQHQCMWWWLLSAEVHSVWLLGVLIWTYLKWYNYKGHTPINFHRFRNWPERYLETCLPNVVIRIPNVENPASPYTGCDGVLNIWYVFKGPSHNAFGISNFSRT